MDWLDRHALPSHEALAQRLAEARGIVAGAAHRTPVLRSRTLDTRVGAEVFLKCESFQRGGAFKFRGAWHALSRLAPEARARGVVAYSSGNHAQAVALAAREFGVPATLVMPSAAPAAKLEATRGYGAEVLLHDRLGMTREALAEQVARERGAVLVPPFDHPDIVCGQGTAAAELLEQCGPLDRIVAPLGGGGLLSGTGLAAAADGRGCRVWGAEPEAGDDGARSLASGRLVRIEAPDTIADGARTPSLSPLTFALIQRYAEGIVTVPDDALVRAMRFAGERLKLVVEPTGVLALAALLEGRLPPGATRVGVVISGGNVDLVAAAAWFSPERSGG